MAIALVDQMTEKWDPERYTDDYSSALMALIKDKIAHGDKSTVAPKKARRETKVIDLAAVLKESLTQAGAASPRKTSKVRKKRTPRRAKPRKAA